MDITLSRIEKLVEETGLTTRELAEEVGCSKSAIQRYLTGQRDIPTSVIIGFAKAFNVHPAYLFGWTDDRNFSVNIEKPAAQDGDELSANKQALFDLVRDCPEDKAARLLQIMKLFLDNERQEN